jgi:hypothetical protein
LSQAVKDDPMILNDTYLLPNGVSIPKLGLGTWRIDDDKVAQAVRDAAAIGYRHFDTAQGYQNERGVGEGIRTCGLSATMCLSPPSSMLQSRPLKAPRRPSTGRSRRWASITST